MIEEGKPASIQFQYQFKYKFAELAQAFMKKHDYEGIQ